jgi:hypothetical protein
VGCQRHGCANVVAHQRPDVRIPHWYHFGMRKQIAFWWLVDRRARRRDSRIHRARAGLTDAFRTAIDPNEPEKTSRSARVPAAPEPGPFHGRSRFCYGRLKA